MKHKFKDNLIFGLAISILFITIEIVFRLQHDNLYLFLKLNDYLTIFVLFIALSFLQQRLSSILLVILSSLFIVEIGHFNYFGYFLFPMEFILFFTKSHEIFETLNTKLNILIEPILYSLTLIFFIKKINIITSNRINFNKFKYLFLLLICIPIINTAIHYKTKSLGEKPNTNKSIIKNSLYVTKSFFGKTLPIYLFNLQVVKYYKQDTFKNKNQNQIDNVILIIGESLSLHYMSLYGYEIKTTKNLDNMKNMYKNIYISKAISAGVFTDTSIPMILNTAKKPNALELILSHKGNLFKLAKEHNFTTHWISSQANDGFSYIRSYMGLKYIDKYIDSTTHGFDKFTSAYDTLIYEEIKKINLDSNNNFIVLNMVGSHSPYNTRVPNNFKPFGEDNDLNHYQNSVAYTDIIISNIIKYIKENSNSKTLLIFTSDHGQSVSKEGYGHGNINNIKHYQVPLLFFTNNFILNEDIRTTLKNNYLSHHTMSLITAYYLGYDTLTQIDTNQAFVIGNDLSGSAGYVEYNLTNNQIIFK
jgi:glucan phosphoethanolaminetransferase (alkaline phosphatase superfamily)